MATTLIDRTGVKTGRITVIQRANRPGDGRPTWLCKCDCGNEKVFTGDDIFKKGKGRSCVSCGCRNPSFRHGDAPRQHASVEYRAWASMIQRCYNPNHPSFMYWGGRGITVCERWRDYRNFISDMGRKPYGFTLDRWPNNDGNYEPGNCRWATHSQQNKNRRKFR